MQRVVYYVSEDIVQYSSSLRIQGHLPFLVFDIHHFQCSVVVVEIASRVDIMKMDLSMASVTSLYISRASMATKYES